MPYGTNKPTRVIFCETMTHINTYNLMALIKNKTNNNIYSVVTHPRKNYTDQTS